MICGAAAQDLQAHYPVLRRCFRNAIAARPERPNASGRSISLLFGLSVMPRQPLKRVIPLIDRPFLYFGIACPDHRPELTEKISRILLAWPHVESHMGVVLGLLLGADSAAALSVYEILRRSSNQRDAIEAAAKFKLQSRDIELLSAVLNAHRSIEQERNAFTHGHIGWTGALPNAILWITAADYMRFSVQIYHGGLDPRAEGYDTIVDRAFVYTETDIIQINDDVKSIWRVWIDLNAYLASFTLFQTSNDAEYDRLCGLPRVAQELALLRLKKKSSINTDAVTPVGSG